MSRTALASAPRRRALVALHIIYKRGGIGCRARKVAYIRVPTDLLPYSTVPRTAGRAGAVPRSHPAAEPLQAAADAAAAAICCISLLQGELHILSHDGPHLQEEMMVKTRTKSEGKRATCVFLVGNTVLQAQPPAEGQMAGMHSPVRAQLDPAPKTHPPTHVPTHPPHPPPAASCCGCGSGRPRSRRRTGPQPRTAPPPPRRPGPGPRLRAVTDVAHTQRHM
jgi:hypothetical protein